MGAAKLQRAKALKVWTVSLAYTSLDIIEESIAQYYATKHSDVETVHLLVDQHWPLYARDRAARLRDLCQKFGLTYLDPGKNLGLHDGFNWALEQVAIPDNAMVIGYDPDSYPVTKGWDMAMCDLFVAYPWISWLSLWHQHCDRQIIEEKAAGPELYLGGLRNVRCFPVKRAVMNSVCGIRRGWLRSVGGLTEGNKFYGGLEVAMWEKLQQTKSEWVFLPDYKEIPHFQDRMEPLYREWKWAHAHERTFPGDFDSYLTMVAMQQ